MAKNERELKHLKLADRRDFITKNLWFFIISGNTNALLRFRRPEATIQFFDHVRKFGFRSMNRAFSDNFPYIIDILAWDHL